MRIKYLKARLAEMISEFNLPPLYLEGEGPYVALWGGQHRLTPLISRVAMAYYLDGFCDALQYVNGFAGVDSDISSWARYVRELRKQ